MRRWLLGLLAASAAAQTFQLDSFHGRQAYVLENGRIRVSALRGGGHLAEVRFLAGDPQKRVNPMRVPHYPTIEPYLYNPTVHDAVYGSGSHRWLSSGYMGHLLCFPSFGPPSEGEIASQLGNHGEAPIVEWIQKKADVSDGAVTLWYGADLPRTQFRVERAVTLLAGETVVYVEEWVENLARYDRPINWVQHATFGPPFAAPAKNFLDVPATKGEVGGGRPGANSLAPGAPLQWPEGKSREGKPVSLRAFQPVPHAGTYYALLLDPARAKSYFTVYNPEFPVLIGYLFPTADHPWLGDWQENQGNTTRPWDGKAVARGLEFGTTPFPEGLRKSVERGRMFGVPTYRWIGARGRLKTTFLIFLAEIPSGFAGVEDVAVEPGRIAIRERGAGGIISVKSARRW